MTKEQILAMKVGEKLDDLVADTLGLPKPSYNTPTFSHYYSLNISDAFQIVEKMDTPFILTRLVTGTRYRATFNWSFENEVEAKTVSEAICKAALLAMLEK